MKNFIYNFLITTTIWFLLKNEFNLNLFHYFVMLVVFQPYRIKGSVYSIFGGINNKGNIYSLCAIVQRADDKCFSLFGVCLYQGGDFVTQGVGITLFQEGFIHASQWFGFIGYQEGRNSAYQILGLTYEVESKEITGNRIICKKIITGIFKNFD